MGGKRKEQRGRATAGKRVVFGLLEREGRVYTKVVESVSAEELLQHIQAHTRKNSVYFTDAFRGYQSLKRYGHHHTVNHAKTLVSRRTKNHINGIEGFGSYAKHILYQYRGVSKYHFPMYLKEIECRFNHRQERGGLGNLNTGDKWHFCSQSAFLPFTRRDHDETSTPEP